MGLGFSTSTCSCDEQVDDERPDSVLFPPSSSPTLTYRDQPQLSPPSRLRRGSSIGAYEDLAAGGGVAAAHGVTKRGHLPSKPGWKNQDSIGIATDPSTGALLVVVCDGHGPSG